MSEYIPEKLQRLYARERKLEEELSDLDHSSFSPRSMMHGLEMDERRAEVMFELRQLDEKILDAEHEVEQEEAS